MGEIYWWVAPVIAAIVGGLFTSLVLKRCAHSWELVDKTEFPPPWDSLPGGQAYYNHDLKWLMTRTVVLALRCPKCGAAKIEKVTST